MFSSVIRRRAVCRVSSGVTVSTGPGGEVVGQDQRPPFGADQGEAEVAEREDPREPPVAVNHREERLVRVGPPAGSGP